MSYTYDGSNNLTSATNLAGNVTNYSYDALNRLTDALTKTSGGTQSSDYSYGYDGVGNRTSATANGVATTYSYNFDNELLKSTQGNVITNYTYDGNGNETTGNGRTFTIDLKNQTTEIDTTNPTSYNNYVYSGTDQTDRVEAKGVVDVFSALGLSIEGEGSSTPTYYTRSNAGQIVNERTTSGTYYYLTDDLGSVVDLVDSNGNVKNSYSYDPYGNSISKSETVTNPWQYAGGYLDANTGLYKFGARYYDPALGRWTQLDSQGGGYVYAGDVPNMLVDPNGRFAIYPEYGLYIPSIGPVLTVVSVEFTGEELASLQGSGGGVLKVIIRNGLTGLGVPGYVKDIVLGFIDFQVAELVAYSDINCGGNGAVIYISVLFSPLPSLQCPGQ